jgi:hypothetical protein
VVAKAKTGSAAAWLAAIAGRRAAAKIANVKLLNIDRNGLNIDGNPWISVACPGR